MRRDPSFPSNRETPDDLDPERVVERWREIEARGQLIPDLEP